MHIQQIKEFSPEQKNKIKNKKIMERKQNGMKQKYNQVGGVIIFYSISSHKRILNRIYKIFLFR